MVRKKPIVVGLGELLWDMLPSGKRAGGAPINVVYHASRQGAEGYAISAVGNDALGDEIIAELDKKHIHYILERNEYPTGAVEVMLNNGIPSYEIVEGRAWDYISETPAAISLMQKANAVCFGTLAFRNDVSRKSLTRLLGYAAHAEIKFFDINLRLHYYSVRLIDDALIYANVFKVNDEELPVLRRLFRLRGSDEAVCRYLREHYHLKYLIFTAGEKFSIVYGDKEQSYLPTPQVEVKDTVGAGDAFSGTFIMALLRGEDIFTAHRRAVEIAAFVCTQPGAWPDYGGETDE